MRCIVLLVVAACGAKLGDLELAANQDMVAVEMNTSVDVAVLDNDVGVDDAAVVVLLTSPAHGDASIVDGGLLHYAPRADYLGDDTIEYQVSNSDGTHAIASVALHVDCATCAFGGSITLTWEPNPVGDAVLGYRVYRGASLDVSTFKMVDDVLVTRPGFDPTAPSVTYASWDQLRLRVGELACFALTAYNATGESGFSSVACKTVERGSMMFGL